MNARIQCFLFLTYGGHTHSPSRPHDVKEDLIYQTRPLIGAFGIGHASPIMQPCTLSFASHVCICKPWVTIKLSPVTKLFFLGSFLVGTNHWKPETPPQDLLFWRCSGPVFVMIIIIWPSSKSFRSLHYRFRSFDNWLLMCFLNTSQLLSDATVIM